MPVAPSGSLESGSSKRRLPSEESAGNTIKKAKLAPLFIKKPTEPALFNWIKPNLGPKKSLLYGVNLNPKASSKIAAFDLDDTLIRSTSPSATDGKWRWWTVGIPTRLRQLHDDGYAVIFVSNQGQRAAVIKYWQNIKIPSIAAAVTDLPFRIFAATEKDGFRKPMPGIWYEIERIFGEDGIEIDKKSSFFVGDAAGRLNDHAASDRKWALNLDIPFFTPEEYFLGEPAKPHILPGWNVSELDKKPISTPTDTPLLLSSSTSHKVELVVFVGYPCLGKSSFYRRHFQPIGYTHVNQDILKKREKCVQAVKESLRAGLSCVVDNTNRDFKTRKFYVDVARGLDVPIRCFIFDGDAKLAWHNNLYRAYNMPPNTAHLEPQRDLLPYFAIAGYEKDYEKPAISEGFSEIKTINWVFEGNAEARRRWSMWLQLDDKMPKAK